MINRLLYVYEALVMAYFLESLYYLVDVCQVSLLSLQFFLDQV